MTYRFSSIQLVFDIIRTLIAFTLVAFGHPYIGVIVAMIYIEAN